MGDGITWVELCCGAAATTLELLGGHEPIVGWMGGKRRQAPAILAAMGLGWHTVVDDVVLCDAGSWGWVWPVLLDAEHGEAVAHILRSWEGRDPVELWNDLRSVAPAESLTTRTAGWLWLEARSASSVPCWWSGTEWRMADRNGPQGRRDRVLTQSGTAHGRLNGLLHPAKVASRIDWLSMAVKDVSWIVHSGDASTVAAIDGAYVYIDPPYVGRTGYEMDLQRDVVLDIANKWSSVGCIVAISEAVPLDLPGWSHVDLTACGRRNSGPEWLTINRIPASTPDEQLRMFGCRNE